MSRRVFGYIDIDMTKERVVFILRLHGVTSHRTVIFIVTAVRTANSENYTGLHFYTGMEHKNVCTFEHRGK
jgi:hypothetical protein